MSALSGGGFTNAGHRKCRLGGDERTYTTEDEPSRGNDGSALQGGDRVFVRRRRLIGLYAALRSLSHSLALFLLLLLHYRRAFCQLFVVDLSFLRSLLFQILYFSLALLSPRKLKIRSRLGFHTAVLFFFLSLGLSHSLTHLFYELTRRRCVFVANFSAVRLSTILVPSVRAIELILEMFLLHAPTIGRLRGVMQRR